MGLGALQQRLLDPLQLVVGDLGAATSRATALEPCGSCGLPTAVPAAGALAGDVQLAGDLGLGPALGEQLGGAFSAGLTLGPLAGASLSCLLLAAVGRHGQGCFHTTRPAVTLKRKNQK
jgi:hypothetical protein